MAVPSPKALFPLPVLWLFTTCAFAAPAEHPGAVLYKKLCADCHGANGEGVKDKYDDKLVGELSVDALARKIDRTMPEDKEHLCVGEEAKQVAAYVYKAFYSPDAQARAHPPKKDLSRLTIAQYRASVMDLIGRFRMGPGFDRPVLEEQGLKAVYRGTELPKPGEKAVDTTPKQGIKKKRPNYKLERVDGQVAFHFGAGSPDPEKMETEQFENRWEGSVVAEETGVYEFILKTENGARLWINDTSEGNALIDAWVSAGPHVREEKKSLFLVGGRAYRLVLDHFKFKEKSSSIELWWKPPHGVAEIIPPHALRTDRPRELTIVSTNFPADDRSVGYERGTSISKGWDQATTEAAIATAEHVEEKLNELAGTKDGAADRVEKLKKFAFTFVEAAFCRPLSAEQKELYVETQFRSAGSPEKAVKRVVLFTLKSPQFLYPELRETEKPDDFSFASRLALSLWDSIPDKKLMQTAAAGKLNTPAQIRAEALRMLPDTRTRAKLQGFFHHWLELERAEGNAKDPKVFPGFDDQVLADLRESLLEFLDQVVWSENSDYRELLRADYLLLNDRLGKFYGKPVQGGDFQRVSFDPKQRAGVVTHPYLLASLASSRATSPIHRGVFLTRNIVGLSLRPPPMAVTFDESHFNPKLTMREKITELTRNNTCMSCHSTINPLGFSLENFDAIGRWRTKDNNKPVNAVGEFADDEGRAVRLTGPRDIVNYVADNPAGHRAFIRQLFNHFVKQAPPAYGSQTLDGLQHSFAATNCSVQKLLVEIAMVAVLDDQGSAPPAR
jgi:mono/diheme cytochrome c family protein